ncbi:two-component system, OmpR family, sensor histidine kinase CiaH [Clostridium cavendishii DSM 21758]|uniref:histidine kinase n=1 Tax=Clostridium cavendishii DSM 21758 TaxID=1121302 RepID=A0A1M6TFW4_9CLOT|nr:HAMP domain-containing sensor histidine kinase [Clostridium cavendishii]SHK55774.1 two-component system, OmpR family, sensor histidine kinase CiaH [Clostridium cavendishii DSM 21758]
MRGNKKKVIILATNIIIYIVLFSIFSLIIYKFVSSNQYESVDKELLNYKDTMIKHKKGGKGGGGKQNPRIIVVAKDSLGNIKSYDFANEFIMENSSELKTTDFDKIQDLKIEDYYFRSLSFKRSDNNKDDIIQLLINTNSENKLLEKLFTILIFGGTFIIILSIGASFYLTEKSMKPILESWEKQRQFVENASHELRTPLTIIQTKLEALLKEPNSKIIDKVEYISMPLSETRRLSKLVSSLLTLARADSNSTEIEIENLNIKALIYEIVETYKEIGELEEKSVRLEFNGDEFINCDKDRIKQLLIILLDNAMKYTDSNGVIEVIVNNSKTEFILCIEDDGIGVKSENRQRIFERFFREDKARSRETGGSGLGLSIAYWIVKKHGGNIMCIENRPKGSIFKVILPKK